MANKLDPMDLKQIISLHIDGLSNRKIAKLLGIGRNTVNAYMQLFEASGRSLGELIDLGDHQLQDLFPSQSNIDNERFDRLMQYFEKVNQARDHPGFTFLFHYQEYQHQEPKAYSYTQFMEHYHRRPNSDIDLTLIGENLTINHLFSIETQLDDLLLPYKMDVSIFSQIDNDGLIEHIGRVGSVIYTNTRDPNL